MSLQKLASFLAAPEENEFKHEFDVEYFAKKASDAYLKNKTSLNSSIKKYAEDNGFNLEQTKRICEAANHQVNQHLFNTQEDKNIYFEVADPDTFQSEPVKVASVNEYSFSPREILSWGSELEKKAEAEDGGIQLAHFKGEHKPGMLFPALGAGLGAAVGPHLMGMAPNIAGRALGAGLGGLIGYGASKAEQYSRNKSQEANPMFQLKKNLEMYPERFAIEDSNVSGLDPKLSFLALKEKVSSLLQKTEDDLYMGEFRIKEAQYKLSQTAKEVLKTEPYYKLAQAMAMSTNHHEILEDLTWDLMQEGLVSEEDLFAIVKTAGELDTSHPLVAWTKKYAELLDKKASSLVDQKELQEQLLTIEKELK